MKRLYKDYYLPHFFFVFFRVFRGKNKEEILWQN